MKKVLSLVLVAVMALSLATVAFAADIDMIKGGAAVETAVTQNLSMMDRNGEGQKIEVKIDTGASYASDFNITATVKKGSDVVKATVKKDDKKVEIQAIPNMTWSVNKTAEYKVEIKVSSKKAADYGKVTYTVSGIVSLKNDPLTNTSTGTVKDIKNLSSYDVTTANGYLIKASGSNEDVTLNFTELNDVFAYMEFSKLYEQGNVNLVYNQKPAGYKDIQKANIDAELSFINFVAAPKFDVAGKFVIEADKGSYIYEIKDGKLAETKFAWDDTVGGYSVRTNVLGAYVVSDIELEVAAAGSAQETNPGTGANDMVNVAVAMAVVSLAAAGAVAFKKASK